MTHLGGTALLRTALCSVLLAAVIAGTAGELPRLVFPVAGGVKSWKPNFGAARDGGRRSHRGQDLMAPRLTPVLACFPGTVFTSQGAGNAGNWLTILGDCGWSANYMHLNDDKSDGDDDTGTRDMAFAPWLQDGGHVQAGDLIGFVGNSGNAKTSGAHLHFELIGPKGLAVDPASYLRDARIAAAPSLSIPPSTYSAPVFDERIIERPQPMALAPLRIYKDQAILTFGKNAKPAANTEHILRIDQRNVVSSGKSSLSYTWDTRRETDGEHLLEFVRRNIVDGSETVLEARCVLVENLALPARPEISGTKLDLLMSINFYRKRAGLAYVEWDSRLASAADAHTNYWQYNRASARHSAHNETRGTAYFTGENPSDRARFFGYPNGIAECMHFGGARNAADILWAVPYHRLALANVSAQHVGIGNVGETVTVDVGMSGASGVTVFPPDGMTDVPLAGNVNESPSPLRMHRTSAVAVGYVITFASHSPLPGRITVTNAELRDSGRLVECFVNTPANDPAMQSGAILIPTLPLKPLRTYEAYVQAKDASGRDISRRWRFTTGTDATDTSTLNYRDAVGRALNKHEGETKIRGSLRKVAEDGLAFSIEIEGGENLPSDLVGSTMWIGLANGVPVRLGDDPLGIYPARPELTARETVVVIGKGKAPTQFTPRIVIVK